MGLSFPAFILKSVVYFALLATKALATYVVNMLKFSNRLGGCILV